MTTKACQQRRFGWITAAFRGGVTELNMYQAARGVDTKIQQDLAITKWMLGFVIAGVASLIVKAFA